MMKDRGVVHPWVADGKGRLRFGTALSASGDWAQNRDFAQAIEELGFDSGLVCEHPSLLPDCWTTMAAFAAVTRSLRLVSISCVYYRSPQLLARLAADVDRLSGGRLVLGLGAGWAEADFDLLGIPFPPVAERMRHLEETIRIVREIWANPPKVVLKLREMTFPFTADIAPIQQPYVPFMVGGAGEKVILRLVAEYADMANIEHPKASTPEDVRRKLDLVRRLSVENGKSPDAIVQSHWVNTLILGRDADDATARISALPPGLRDIPTLRPVTPRELIAYYRPIIDAGANYLYFCPLGVDLSSAQLFAETVLPELLEYYQASQSG